MWFDKGLSIHGYFESLLSLTSCNESRVYEERLDSYFSMSTVCNFPHTFTQQRKGCGWKGHKFSSLQLVDCLTQAKAAFRDYTFNNPLSYKSLPPNPPFPVKSFLYFFLKNIDKSRM